MAEVNAGAAAPKAGNKLKALAQQKLQSRNRVKLTGRDASFFALAGLTVGELIVKKNVENIEWGLSSFERDGQETELLSLICNWGGQDYAFLASRSLKEMFDGEGIDTDTLLECTLYKVWSNVGVDGKPAEDAEERLVLGKPGGTIEFTRQSAIAEEI